MVEQAFPFDTGPGANVLESEWQKMARQWLTTGVIPAFREELLVTANGAGRQVTVQTGAGWVEGFWYDTDADVVLDVDAADATNPRLDAAVLRLDRLANTMTLDVVPGVPAAVPVLPALSQTDGLWELLLAEVRVPAAAGVITAADVTDRRQFTRNLTLADMAAEVARANAAYVAKPDQVWQRIGEAILNAEGSIVFSSIPATFRHLAIEVSGRGARASIVDNLLVRFNGDVAASYDFSHIGGSGTVTSVGEGLGKTFIELGRVPGATAPAGAAGAFRLDIPDYANTALHKTVLSANGYRFDAATGGIHVRNYYGTWRSTAPINQIHLLGEVANLAAGTIATLYGMKGA